MADKFDLIISKENDAFIKIDADKGVVRTLYEHFSFYKDGYKYAPSYKAGYWDGKIKLLDINSKLIPIGLLTDLLVFCKEKQYKTKIIDKQSFLPIDYSKQIEEYLNKMGDYTNYSFTGVYEFQYHTVKHILQKQKCLILSPTACLDENTEIDVLLDGSGIELLKQYREM